MYFQVSDLKGKHFLDLNNNDNKPIHPTYSEDSAWLKHFSLSNLLCAHITRLITSHALANIELGSSPTNHLHVYTAIPPSRQGHTLQIVVHSI